MNEFKESLKVEDVKKEKKEQINSLEELEELIRKRNEEVWEK